MNNQQDNYKTINVRGVDFKLMTYTRSLELCSRMNYETENLDFIDTMRPGSVMYDLGACEGRFSIYAALKGIRVVAFEPEMRNYKVFEQNRAINEIETSMILAVNAGVGAKDENAMMNIGQPWEGGHQKVVEHEGVRNDLSFDFVEQQEIKIKSIDSFLAQEEAPFPDYLKVDIDGSEIPFLKGAEKTLSNPKLKAVIFELFTGDSNFEGIMKTMFSFGFIEESRHSVPNEPELYNIVFRKGN